MAAVSTDGTDSAAAGIHATVTLMASAAFFSGAALRICDSLLPRLAHDFSRTPGAAGQVIISFSVAYGLMQLVFGPLGDRYGKARLMCLSLFGCALAALASALAPAFEALVWTRVAWGMAAAGVIPLAMAWIGDNVPYGQRQATLARFLTGTLSGMMAGQLAGGLFADSSFGWRGAFLMLTAGYGIVAVLLLLRLKSAPPGPAASQGFNFLPQLRAVVSEPWARVVLASVLLEGIFLLGPLSYLPSYLHNRHGLSLSAASALIALYAAGGLVYALTARQIVEAFGERRMVLTGGIIMGTGFLLWWLSPVAWSAGPVALLVGFGTYLFHNTLQTHATQMVPAYRGTAVALFAFSLFGGQAIGVSVAGYTFDHVGHAPLLLVPAVMLPLAGWGFARALGRR
ncbi:MAG: putative rane transport protein [Polaromonas sp.]|nr:putative rane transport protein [Polaromonas sp.]